MTNDEPVTDRRFRRALRAARDGLGRVDPETALLLLAAVATVTLVPIESAIGVQDYRVPVALAFGFALGHVGCIALAVRRPTLATVFSIASVVALQALSAESIVDPTPWPWWPVLIVTQAMIGAIVSFRGSLRLSVAFWILSIVVSSLISLPRPEHYESTSVSLVVFAAVCGGVQIIAGALAQWNDIREQLLSERRVSNEEYSRRVVAEDRARIARELHDVVAHSLSVITVQASTAAFRHDDISKAAAGEFDEIAAASRQAMREMRDLLGVLRADPDVEQAPQPSLADIPELVEQTRRAGADVDVDVWLAPSELGEVSPVAGLVVYRIAQQALANALRHAPGSRVLVSARIVGASLRLTVENGLGREATRNPEAEGIAGTGMGLINMSERAAGVGGTIEAGATPDGGFLVDATVPLRASALAEIERT